MAKKQFNATGGLSVGNIISPISVIDANGAINTPANITGNYYFGNGAFLTGINAGNIEGSYGNANVAAYLASNSNIDIAIGTGNITTRGNVSADYFIGNGAGLTAVRANGNNFQIQYNKNNLLSTDNQFYYDDANAGALYINYTGGGSLWTDDIISSNSVTALGPASIGGNVVTFENFVGNGYYITALEYSNINNAYSNTNAAAYLASNANVTIITTGNIVTAANVSANYVIGNGAFLTGISGGSGNYSNANVAAYLPTYTGTIGATTVTATGNVNGDNINGVIRPTAGSGEAGIMFPTNIGGGSGDSANIKYYIVTGQDTVLELQVTDNSADKIYLNASGGTNVATSLNVSGGITGTTINGTTVTGTSFVGNGSALFGVKYANITGAYGNSNVAAYLPDYTGNLNINGLTVSGIANLGPAGNVKISGGNLNYYLTSDGSGGLAWAAGTSNITGNGSVAGADQQIQYNNGTGNFAASAALRFDYTSNTLIVGGNLSVANINATGNIFGINEDQVAIAVMGNEWTFTQDAYLNLPVNFFAVRYANGANVILGDTYSNSAVSNYLGSNSSVTILTTGNITGGYILGNGRFLTGITAYTNANVASYLQTYNANALFGNVTVSQDAIIQGNLTVLGTTNYNNTTNSIIDAYRVIVANSANTISQLNGAGLQIGNLASGNVEFVYDYTANIMTLSHGANIANILNVSGNTSATYFLGNGRFLSGLGENYSNADVSGFLPIYGGNVRADYTISNVTYSGNILPMYSNTTLANSTVDIGSETYFFSNVYGNKFTVPAGAAGNNSAIQSGENYDGFMFVDTVTGQLASLEAGDAYFGNLTIYSDFEIGNNLQVVGNVNCLSNVTAINFIGNGSALFGIQYSNIIGTYSNSNAAAYLPTYTGNLVSLTGNVTTSANIRSNYNIANLTRTGNILPVYSNAVLANNFVDIGSAQYQFRNIYADKLVTPSGVTGNATEIQSSTSGSGIAFIDSGSGQLAAISAGDSSFTGNVEVDGFIQADQYIQATGNIIAGGNVTGSYILGNGAFLTGINAGNIIGGYGNSQVAAYLQVYNGNASFSNVSVSRDMVVLGNLRVEGNTTEINVSNIFLADKDIIVAANATATLSDLDGAGIQIGNRTAGGNITFFYDSSSNVMELSHGANISNRLEVFGNISGSNINGVIRPTAGSGEAGIIFPANPGGGTGDLASIKYYASAGENTVLELNVNNDSTDTIYLNASGGTNVATSLTVAGNIVGGNITTAANISAGNLSVVNIQVTEIDVTGGALTINATGDIVTTGNLQVINIDVNDINVGGNALTINTTGDIVTTGNLQVVDIDVTNINVGSNALTINATGDIVTTGNLQVNNVDVNVINLDQGTITSNVTQVSIAAGNRTWIYETSGNLLLPGNIVPGANSNNTLDIGSSGTQFRRVYANNYVTPVGTSGGPTLIQSNPIGSGIALIDSISAQPTQIYGNGFITPSGAVGNATLIRNNATGRGISFVDNNTGLLVPISASDSSLSGNLTANGYILGGNLNIGSGALTINILGDIVTTGNLQVNDIDVNDLVALGNITGTYIFGNGAFLTGISGGSGNYSNANVDSYLASNAAVTILTTANITTAANVSGSYILGNGAFLTGISGGSGSYGNANVANYLASNAAVTILTTGNITTAANVSANNIVGSGTNTTITTNGYRWSFNNAGNLVLPGNTFAINYANGTQVSLGGDYSNANVANYLASGSLTSNIITTGNVSGNYILGNGALLTGLPATYSNANVANYLPTYTGNLVSLTGNVTTTANVQAAFLLGNIRSATGGYNDANVAAYTGALTNLTGNVTTTANVQAAFLLGNIRSATGGYNDANVTSYLASNANISITVQGNVSANNFTIGSGTLLGNNPNTTITTGSYSWVFSDNGNLVLPGNTLAVNFANGVSITTSLYSNANAASYLPTYTGNLASLTGNVITTGDISANNLTASNVVTAEFFYGDGIGIGNLQLFDLTSNISTTGNVTAGNYFGNIRNTTGGYGDANVATYLPTYTGNGSFGNLQVTNNVVILGNLQVLGNTTTINANTLSVNDKDIIVANNAVTADELDGAGLQIGNLASGNIQFFYNFASNVMTLNRGLTVANNLSVVGNIIGPAGNMQISAGNMQISASNILLVAGSSTLTFNGAGNVTGSNNIIANYYYGDISNTTGGYGNNSVTGFLGSNSFVPIITAGQIITQANLSAEYLYGNGYFLTGIASNYSNANVAAYLQEFPGNIIPAANGAYNLGSNSNRWNDVYINSTLYLPFQTLTSNSTRIIASSSLSAYDFISTNDITAAANITATGNVSGSYVLGNIRFSTGGYNDANVAAYTGALINLAGNVTTTANVQGAYVLGNIRSATGGYDDANVAAYTGALTNLTGNVTTTANLQGAYVLGNGAFLTGIAAGYSNADVANYLPTYTGALPNLTGNVVTTANVQGGYILGNGYFLSGISGGGGSTYGNANVSDYLASNAAITVLTTANITTAANVAGTYFIGNGAFLTGISAGSSYSNANVADYLASNAAVTITTTANISSSTNVNAGNFSGTGVNTNIRTGSQLWTFGSTGTLTIPGNVNANNYYINNLTNPVQDQDAATKIYVDNLASTAISYHEAVLAATTGTLADATAGTITYNQVNGVGNGIGATLTTTGSFNLIDTANVQTANTRILVKNEANGAHNGVYVWSNATAITRAPMENTAGVANVDAFGINDYFYTTGGNVNKGSAFIVDSPNTAIVFGTSNIQFAVFSQSQVYSANTAAGISLATTTISAKVDNTTTAFDGSGNISVKAGAILTTPNIGAATGTSLSVTGNITSSANISGANFVGGSSSNTTIRTGIYNWTFGNTGNFTLSGNTFAVNYANGTQVSLGGSYSNADVANYLASNAAVTILTTGNITTSANITANNFIGAAGSDPNVGLIAGTYTWNFDNTGNLTLPGNTFAVNYANGTQVSLGGSGGSYGNSNVATYLASNAAVTVLTTGNITTSANVAGNYFIGNGAFLTGIAGGGGGSYGNSNVATYLASNAAVTILTTANITSSANVAAGNFVGNASNTTIKTGAFTWNFASDGQLYLPNNIVAGYRDIPQNSWTGTPTIALADLGEHYYTASGGVTINIPANSSVPLPIGAAVTLINQSGSNCTIARGTTTLYLAGNATSADRTLSHYGFATLVKVATDTWFVNGSNVI